MNTKEALRKIAATTDEALLPLYAAEAELVEAIRETQKIVDGKYSPANKAMAEKRVVSLSTKLAVVRAELAPLDAIAKAGKWSRFVLVPGGHVHRPACHTLYFTTARYIMPRYSGADEAEVVAIAGEAACTFCFPSAPVDRPTQIPELVEEREAREAEKAARKAEKAAKDAEAIPFGKKSFKTLRAAENAVGWEIESVVSRRFMDSVDASHRDHLDRLAAENLGTAREIVAAIEAARPGYDGEALLTKKFAAKVKEYRRNGWEIPADATL